MKKNKIILTTLLIIIAMLVFTGCNDGNLYENKDFSNNMKLGKYKGLSYQKPDTKVSDEQVQQYFDSDLEKQKKKNQVWQ